LADPLTLLIGVAAGVGGGLAVSYYLFKPKPDEEKVKVVTRQPGGELGTRSITVDELNRSRREMRSVVLERDLLSAALMKIYEAETNGRITREEREAIARRYSEQIRSLEGKLKDMELIVEVGEMEKLRDELVSLFKEKIENIEARLDSAKERLQPLRPEIVAKKPVAEASEVEELEKVVERKAPRVEESEAERKVKELRAEVMDALTKLEQIDLEKKPQEKA
jgi:hypothetical protein